MVITVVSTGIPIFNPLPTFYTIPGTFKSSALLTKIQISIPTEPTGMYKLYPNVLISLCHTHKMPVHVNIFYENYGNDKNYFHYLPNILAVLVTFLLIHPSTHQGVIKTFRGVCWQVLY
jgi:hypothetical protein